jgi:hypothetical protein
MTMRMPMVVVVVMVVMVMRLCFALRALVLRSHTSFNF